MAVLKQPITPQINILPNLRNQPSFASLNTALESLVLQPNSWSGAPDIRDHEIPDLKIVNRFLLSVISSELEWFQDGSEDVVVLEQRDTVWALASKRMAERCGRTAMPEMTRTWLVPGPITTSPLTFSIREPPLTGDNLGLKTWGTAFTMAKKLDYLGTKYLSHLFNENAACMNPQKQMQVLELGSGTGLVGIAAAAIWRVPVLLTDLPEIQANLSHNVLQNTQVIETHGGQTDSAILDWKDPDALATRDFEVVIAADPMYDEEHPELVARMIQRFLKRDGEAKALVAVPLRDRKTADMVAVFEQAMAGMGFCLVGQGEEVCRDDWEEEEEGAGVVCWWGVWAWARLCDV